jgi:hypothetical protein
MLCLSQLSAGLQRLPSVMGRAVFAAALAAALGAGCAEHCIVPGIAPPVPAAQCGICHVREEADWRISPHARAYVSDAFKEQTHGYAAKDCLGCHAPGAPSESGGRPLVRDEARSEGVTCVFCHALGHRSRPEASAAELFAGGGALREARFCGRCHEDTFREWTALAAPGKLDCAACHMRRSGEGNAIAADHSLGRGREPFSRYAILADVVEAHRSLERGRVAAKIALENFAADHALPTGGYGFRDVRATIELVDRAGRPLDARVLDLVVAGKGDARPLGPRERREIAAELSDPEALGVAVRVRIEKAGPSGPEPLPKQVAQREVE